MDNENMENENIKIAVCISGFLRTWEWTRNSFEKYFQDMNIDIYAQTYRQNYFECSSKEKDQIYTDEQIKKFFSGLNVVDLIIEDVNEVREKNKIESQKYININGFIQKHKESSDSNSNELNLGERIYDQFRVIQTTADAMRKIDKKYDLIVKTRYDVLYLDIPKWSEFMDGKIHFEVGASGGYPGEILVIGIPSVMSPILDRFNYLELLYNNKNNIEQTNINLDYLINPCECGKILPCCTFCSHSAFRHLISYNWIQIGISSGFCRVQRGKNSIHIPCIGTVEL